MTDLLDLIGFHVDDVPNVDEFLAGVRDFAGRGVNVPHFWVVAAGPKDIRHSDHVELEFGVSATPGVGALAFGHGDGHYVPAHGTNDEDVEYWQAGLHPSYLPPGAEVPLEDVLAGVGEFIRTGRRPTGIQWADAD